MILKWFHFLRNRIQPLPLFFHIKGYLNATEENSWSVKSMIVDYYFHTALSYAHSLLKCKKASMSQKYHFHFVSQSIICFNNTRILYIYAAMCQSFRFTRSVFTWESSYFSCTVMTICFSLGVFLIIFPYEILLLWLCRIAAWTCLGPW